MHGKLQFGISTTGLRENPLSYKMGLLVWVTMTNEGPKIVNLLMNGILDKKGPPKDDDMMDICLYRLCALCLISFSD